MDDQPGPGGIILGLVGMGVCCGLPLIIAGGALAGFGAWFADGGYVTVLLAVAAGTAAIYAWRRLSSPASCDLPLDSPDSHTNETLLEK